MLKRVVLVGSAFLVACGGMPSPEPNVGPPSICVEAPAMPHLGADNDMCDNGDPAERAVGYAAMAAGVVALVIIFIGFYKLAKLIGS
jgi:hypothetical protein